MTDIKQLEERILRLEKHNAEVYRQRKGLHVEPNRNILGQDTYIDGNLYLNNYAAGIWTTWAPTITWDGTAPTSLSGTSVFRYCIIGKAVAINGYAIYGSAGATNTIVTVTLPIAPHPDRAAQAAHGVVGNTENLTRAIIRPTTDDIYLSCTSIAAARLLFMAIYEIA